MISDPFILLSQVNMKLRDEYDTLEELCSALDYDKEELIAKLAEAGFEYIETQNQFK